ncbi:MAG: hypothetical protein NT007_14360 [Candidatus Kapabacteria bacterium]|nr:hypothetical protein [Candidatus Kapabacteria bacterium]
MVGILSIIFGISARQVANFKQAQTRYYRKIAWTYGSVALFTVFIIATTVLIGISNNINGDKIYNFYFAMVSIFFLIIFYLPFVFIAEALETFLSVVGDNNTYQKLKSRANGFILNLIAFYNTYFVILGIIQFPNKGLILMSIAIVSGLWIFSLIISFNSNSLKYLLFFVYLLGLVYCTYAVIPEFVRLPYYIDRRICPWRYENQEGVAKQYESDVNEIATEDDRLYYKKAIDSAKKIHERQQLDLYSVTVKEAKFATFVSEYSKDPLRIIELMKSREDVEGFQNGRRGNR